MDPVIIVGAGPVGLTLALALARQQVPSVVLDEGPGKDEERLARTVVLREDTAALVQRLTGADLDRAGLRWAGWRSMRRKQVIREVAFDDGSAPAHPDTADPAPLHIAQHVLTATLRAALEDEGLVKVVADSRVDGLEQEASGVTVHTRGPRGTWWRGSHVVGCDGPRSTVRKLLDVRFPGRTAVERHAVAALRVDLPWPDEALLHRMPPWRASGPSAGEVTGRPLPDGVWRLDWLLPPGKDLVTPELLVARVRETLAGWSDGSTPAYELLDTGVHTVHHRLARRWRVGRVFLAGDAAHLLGAFGAQGFDEGLRDADNLAWKLALAWHHGPHEALLDSYQQERRAVVSARLRAADQALPLLRGGGGIRAYVPGTARGQDAMLSDGHLGRGPLGAAGGYEDSPLAPRHLEAEVPVGTPPGAQVQDVRVTAEDGSFVRLRDRLGRGALLVLLIAPGTGVWERRHWVSAGIMPRLAAAVTALPSPAELLVAESYPGAAAHTVLLIRPDGHLVAALNGVRAADLYAAAEAALGGPATAQHAQKARGAHGTGGTDGSDPTGRTGGAKGTKGAQDAPAAGAAAGSPAK
ncbi:FAD-dependent monooxygenase [Streptomyces hilarionis]|uniref:FAD-dependent monooxygenase n=1 Tax=Streptomyces hilarionis TaxID=2839954 RepID=UPI00211A5FA4|nr:FAD-dependent monooxygenase [Streptomyces hilarionis]MCQ9130775.1 FAD-dependent monooxygenase [Streptomyces hilarionis]